MVAYKFNKKLFKEKYSKHSNTGRLDISAMV